MPEDNPDYKAVRDRLNKLIADNCEVNQSVRMAKARSANELVYKMYHDTDTALVRVKAARKEIASHTTDEKKARSDLTTAIGETQKARESLSKAHAKITNAIKMIEKLDRK